MFSCYRGINEGICISCEYGLEIIFRLNLAQLGSSWHSLAQIIYPPSYPSPYLYSYMMLPNLTIYFH